MTTTETRVPSPEQEVAQEAPAANLPELRAAEPMRDPEGNPIRVHGHTATKDFGEVVGAIAAVMSEIQPVEKGGKNTFHDYKYARMQDILQALTPLMGKHGIVVFQYEAARNMFDDGKVMAITYDFIVAHKSGQTWINPVPQTGMSPCRTSNGKFDDKSFAKCHTSARKYFLLSLFQIPTEDESDPDNQRRERTAGPVPSPDGHVAPHLIEPTQRDTFEKWADRYLGAARTSKTLAELEQWDLINDNPLAQMDANEKGKPVYERVLKEFEDLRARLQSADPISSGPRTKSANPDANEMHPKAGHGDLGTPEPFVRPKGCPDAEKDPDAFLVWAQKRMDGITGAAELQIVWEGEIAPASDGLFRPDCLALEEYFNKRLEKLEG